MPVALPPWLSRLRRTEVVDRVREDSRSGHGTPLGVPADAVPDAIGWGQADFDQPFGGLNPDDRVLLYAHWNQRGHLEELTTVFRHVFGTNRPDNPIVVDIGCGPCTGGLAVAATLESGSGFDYIGVDRSETMRRFGKRIAAAARAFEEAPPFRAHWARDLPSISWGDPPGWRPVIVIVSYLFASPTLDAGALADQLEDLFHRLGRGQVMVLYTNSTKPRPNLPLADFHEKLTAAGFRRRADHEETIEVERSTGPKSRAFRCALWHRPLRDRFRPGTV